MQCRDYYGEWSRYTDFWQYGLDADMRLLNLTLHWYLDQNLNPATDYFTCQVSLKNTSSSYTYSLFYFLNGTYSMSNTTNTGVFLLDGPEQQWNRLSRNLTADFLAVPELPNSTNYLECAGLSFFMNARSCTTQYFRAFVDDIYLENDTTTWIGGATGNGNFETSNLSPWNKEEPEDPGYYTKCATAHSGSWSANMTSLSLGNHSYTQFYQQPDIRATSLNPVYASFWWQLSLKQASATTQSYLQIRCRNSSNSLEIWYWLGHGGPPWGPYSNTSSTVYFHAEGFNTTGSWSYFSRNIWADAITHFSGLTELYISYFDFQTHAMSAGERVVTLVDDVRIIGNSLNDAGYEDQLAPGERVRGWGTTLYSNFRVANTAYSGSKAANITLPNTGLEINAYQPVRNRPVNGTRETYMDLMWNLQDTTPPNFFYIRVSLSNFTHSVSLYYHLCRTIGMGSNTTNQLNFNVTGANTLDTWMPLHRDLWHDYEASGFGSLSPSHYISEVALRGWSGGGRLEVLLDDFYIYDDPAPRLSNIVHTPSTPDQGDSVVVSVDAEDQDLETVLLHYRVDGSTWTTVIMSAGASYDGTIPSQDTGTLIEYYITANDTWGMTTTDDNSGAYYSYTVTTPFIPPPLSPLLILGIAVIIIIVVVILLWFLRFRKPK